jgi:hypothetical protein
MGGAHRHFTGEIFCPAKNFVKANNLGIKVLTSPEIKMKIEKNPAVAICGWTQLEKKGRRANQKGSKRPS